MKIHSKARAFSWLVYWAGVIVGIIPLPLALVGLVRFPTSTVLVVLTFIPGFAVAVYGAEVAFAVLCLLFSRLRTLGKRRLDRIAHLDDRLASCLHILAALFSLGITDEVFDAADPEKGDADLASTPGRVSHHLLHPRPGCCQGTSA
jgi:uncharacterized membrane protein YjdF